MRIVILCSGSAVFGLEIISLNLARALRARGHDVQFVVSAWTDGEFARRLTAYEFPFEGVFLGRISKSLKPRAVWWTISALLHLPVARRRVRAFLDRAQPDVVIVNHRDWLLLLGSILPRDRVLFHVHELPLATPLMRRVFKRINERVAAFVAVSANIAERLKALGAGEEKTHVVRNGIEPLQSQTSHSTGTRERTVGVVGQIGVWKGHDDLLSALSILNSNGCQAQCSIFGVGDDGYVASLREKAASLALRDRITWHGYVRDPKAIYADIDVCVIPSRFDDPFPTVAIEAAMCGVPVVATRRGGLPEIVVDGETGILVDAENPGQLAAAIGRLLNDSALRRRLGLAAQRRAREHFTTAQMADRVETLLREIASSAELAR